MNTFTLSSDGISSSANLPNWIGFKCEAITGDSVDGSAKRNLCRIISFLIPITSAMDSISCRYDDGHPEIVVADINFSRSSGFALSCDSMRIRFISPKSCNSSEVFGSLATFSVGRDYENQIYNIQKYIYIYIYIYVFDSWNLDCDPWVSWSFVQNNRQLTHTHTHTHIYIYNF